MRFGVDGEIIHVDMHSAASKICNTTGNLINRGIDLAIIPATQAVFVYPQEAGAEITGYSIGDIGRLVELQAVAYHQRCGYDFSFEVFVARELADFIANFDAACDGLWLYKKAGSIVGCVAIDGHDSANDGAKLRFLIVHPAHQRRGVGRVLMENAIAFCKDKSMSKVSLWTMSMYFEARQLYKRFGFVQVDERSGENWGVKFILQKFELALPSK